MHISIYTDFAALIYFMYLIIKQIRGYKSIGLWHKTNNHPKIKCSYKISAMFYFKYF